MSINVKELRTDQVDAHETCAEPLDKITVIVPVYNVSAYIRETIESLLKQTYPNMEVVFVDDGSTDDTAEIIASYVERYPDIIHLVRQPNRGPAAARNHGLRVAQGDYVFFLDSDDVLSPDALEVLHRAAVEHEADITMGPMVRFQGTRQWFIQIQQCKGVNTPGPKTLYTHPGVLYALGPCAKLYRRHVVEDNWFPEHLRLGEDQPFVLRAYLRARKIYTVSSPVYFYRVREEGASLTQSALQAPIDSLADLFEMLRLNDEQLRDHPELRSYYLERVMRCDIWPRCVAALRTRDADVQSQALQRMRAWVATLPSDLLNATPYVLYLILIGPLARGRNLRGKALLALWRLYRETLVRAQHNALIWVMTTLWRRVKKRAQTLWKQKCRTRIRGYRTKLELGLTKHVVFAMAKLLPVHRKKVVLASNKSSNLEGNLAVIADAVRRDRPDWKICTLLKRDRNLWQKCVQFFHLGTASVVVVDDYYPPLYGLRGRRDGEVVQVWHAAGAFKKFGISAVGSGDANSLDFELKAHRSYTKVIVSSREVVPHYAEAFNMDPKDVLPLGVPQTDILWNREFAVTVHERYGSQFPMLLGKKRILYAPTFRGRPAQRRRFKLDIDLQYMKAVLGRDYVVLLKLHPAVRQVTGMPKGLDDFVLNLSDCADIHELMVLSDILVTDYSSVIFDYSVLGRPMLFYAYDLDSYLAERGFYYEYESFVPGPISRTTEELVEHIVEQRWDLSKVNAFATRFFDDRDGLAAKRFIDTFLR
ncbi:MAG: CDP-glycerol glycerophosphotransferase family protein [Thermoflavifilum sp.]|nr:CDP-glycerol glycerophosphotransferase family protein [Thermoflavifilum sp.]MCL6514305.1 bifunctional glycosyltransferase family 2 protein/CDP-glycerol:glycerophosphate glycerophosphotransferase [Alicyclobacillus sp.]